MSKKEFESLLNYHLRSSKSNSPFSEAQRKFVRAVFDLTHRELVRTDWSSFKNIQGCALALCLKAEYQRLIDKHKKFRGFSKSRFDVKRTVNVTLNPYTPNEEEIVEMKKLLRNYYNNIMLPVLNRRGDFTNIKNYKLKKIGLKENN